MSEEERDQELRSRGLDAVDEDPPPESRQLAELKGVREPDDDDPPAEPLSPWDEVEPIASQLASSKLLLDENADEDPPSEPRSVESIPHARLSGR